MRALVCVSQLKDIAVAHATRLSRMTSRQVTRVDEEVESFLRDLRDAKAGREPPRQSLQNAALAAEVRGLTCRYGGDTGDHVGL
jgi:hypothetical protein